MPSVEHNGNSVHKPSLLNGGRSKFDFSSPELQAFVHGLAHDLKEPLRTISALTQLLVNKAQLDEADAEIGEFIVDGARRMSALLDHLLATVTDGPPEPLETVHLERTVELAMQNLREALISSDAVVTIGTLPAVPGHECDLIRVFQNLIANALKYRAKVAVQVHITGERSGADWLIRVRDNGIGIQKEHHRRVFSRYTRLHTDEEIPGTGLGLAVCRDLVEERGGTIWVESEPGAGSTFCFTCPVENVAA